MPPQVIEYGGKGSLALAIDTLVGGDRDDYLENWVDCDALERLMEHSDATVEVTVRGKEIEVDGREVRLTK